MSLVLESFLSGFRLSIEETGGDERSHAEHAVLKLIDEFVQSPFNDLFGFRELQFGAGPSQLALNRQGILFRGCSRNFMQGMFGPADTEPHGPGKIAVEGGKATVSVTVNGSVQMK